MTLSASPSARALLERINAEVVYFDQISPADIPAFRLLRDLGLIYFPQGQPRLRPLPTLKGLRVLFPPGSFVLPELAPADCPLPIAGSLCGATP